MIAWVFVPSAGLGLIKPELLKLLPQAQTTNLQTVLPWLYCICDRKPDADIAVTDGEHGQSKDVPNS